MNKDCASVNACKFYFQYLISVNVHGAICPAVLMFVAPSSPVEGRGRDTQHPKSYSIAAMKLNEMDRMSNSSSLVGMTLQSPN